MADDKKTGSDKPKDEIKTKPTQIVLEKRKEVKSSYTRDHSSVDHRKGSKDDGNKK